MQDDQFTVVVKERVDIAEDVACFTLASIEGSDLPAFTAGAHIELALGNGHRRAYSICSQPSDLSHYQIAVKREDPGRGGSAFIHDQFHVGSEVSISAPKNYFALDTSASSSLLIGGGIGITPLLSMAFALTELEKPFEIIFCSSRYESPLFEALCQKQEWKVTFINCGREGLASVLQDKSLDADTHVYCCGPNAFMADVRKALDVNEANWHQESFTAESVAVETSTSLYLSESDLTLELSEGESMLDVIRSAGIEVETVCEQGVCGSCVVAWRDGEPVHNDSCMDDDERGEYVALCCAGCRSSSLTLEL